eukprot:1329008-Amorphochlora_amoeboformis.AAC.2
MDPRSEKYRTVGLTEVIYCLERSNQFGKDAGWLRMAIFPLAERADVSWLEMRWRLTGQTPGGNPANQISFQEKHVLRVSRIIEVTGSPMAPQGRRGVSRGVFQVIISSFVLLGSTNFPLRKALHLRSSGNITRRPRDAAKGSDFRPQPCLHEPTRLHTSGLHRLHRLRGGSGESLEQALRSSLVGLSEGERKAAEAAVFALEKQPGFLHALLSILAKYKTEPGNISMQAAAIRFKNTIREHWAYDPEGNEPEFTITETEKKEVREIILQAMCEVSPVAQRLPSLPTRFT